MRSNVDPSAIQAHPAPRAVKLFEIAAPIHDAPDSVRIIEFTNPNTGERLPVALTLLREIESESPVALHVTMPATAKGLRPYCFFLGAWTNTFADLGDTTTFFVEPGADVDLLMSNEVAYADGECTEESAPALNPAYSAVWTRRETGEALSDIVMHRRKVSANG